MRVVEHPLIRVAAPGGGLGRGGGDGEDCVEVGGRDGTDLDHFKSS